MIIGSWKEMKIGSTHYHWTDYDMNEVKQPGIIVRAATRDEWEMEYKVQHLSEFDITVDRLNKAIAYGYTPYFYEIATD